MNGLEWGFPAALAPPGPCKGEIKAGRVRVCLCSAPRAAMAPGSGGCPGWWRGDGFGPGVTSADCGVNDGSVQQKSGEMGISHPLCCAERMRVGTGHPSAHPAGHTLLRDHPGVGLSLFCNFTLFLPTLQVTPCSEKAPGVGLPPLCNFSSFLFPLPWLSLCRDSTTVSAGEPARARATGTGVGSDFLATPFPIKHRVLFCQPELKPCSREEPKAHPVVAQLCHRGHHELLAAPALPFASADLPPPTIKTIWEKGPCCWNSTHRISTAWRFFSTF